MASNPSAVMMRRTMTMRRTMKTKMTCRNHVNLSSKSTSSYSSLRSYCCTRTTCLDNGTSDSHAKGAAAEGNSEHKVVESTTTMTTTTSPSKQHQEIRRISMEYNHRRAEYERNVTKYRNSYWQEYQQQVNQDTAEEESQRLQITRKRLERQRLKNERSVQNAKRQEELRRQAQLAFQDHLQTQQELREQKRALKQRAQQLLLQELEEEAPLWLTTHEEVEAAFSLQAEQLLWARPQGVLGVPQPSLDCHFWNYQGHTWDMSKTYRTPADLLVQDLQDQAYWETNIDPSIWTPEQILQQEMLEQKAQLRANVRHEGRKSLLKRQKEYLEESNPTIKEKVEEKHPSSSSSSSSQQELPKPLPVPSLGILANLRAQEKEGVQLLLQDPTKFFVFDSSNTTNDHHDRPSTDSKGTKEGGGDDDHYDSIATSSSYTGPSLGTPIALRDPLQRNITATNNFTNNHHNPVFPLGIGKLPKPDLRTEKEKKRQEREERLWAAAAAAKNEDDKKKISSEELLLIPEEDREIGPPLNYDENEEDWDSDDEEWERGLDEVADAHILQVPREFRYREQDLEFAIEQLEQKAALLQSHIRNTIQTMEQEARSRINDNSNDNNKSDVGETNNSDDTTGASSTTPENVPFFDAVTTAKLQSIGANVERYERLMASLTQEQLLSLFALEAKRRPQQRVSGGENDDYIDPHDDIAVLTATASATAAAAAAAPSRFFEEILPRLTPEQMVGLTELESFLHILEEADAATTNNSNSNIES